MGLCGAHLAEMGEELAANDELEDEIERDLVLESGEQVDHKGVLHGRVGELKTPWGMQGANAHLDLREDVAFCNNVLALLGANAEALR